MVIGCNYTQLKNENGNSMKDDSVTEKTAKELAEEINELLKSSITFSADEEIKYDAEFGYFQEKTEYHSDEKR